MGLFFLLTAYTTLDNGPPLYSYESENALTLLESGKIIKGQVNRSRYEKGAPEGWQIIYSFETEDPSTKENKKLLGKSRGPAKYYRDLSKGDTVEIIYNPLAPKVNCEIRCFLNDPVYRQDFKKAGKLHLLDKFKDEYELEDYTSWQWAELQWEK